MTERLSDKLRQFLKSAEGREITTRQVREETRVQPGTPAWEAVRVYMHRFVAEGLIKPSGRNDGVFKVIKRAKSIQVFGREKRPPLTLNPPRDYETKEPLGFWDALVVRENDLWVIAGYKNAGKTALCMNILGENLDMKPVVMGNEFSLMGEDGEHEPSPRFINRLEGMDWVEWTNGNGEERFELLPVYDDYAEQVKPARLNIIDWINLPTELWMIGSVFEGIKRALRGGIGVGVIQKNIGRDSGRGGAFTKDFADVELLLDPYGDDKDMVLLTVETVKECNRAIMGKRYVYRIKDGVKIVDFREVFRCGHCFGKGWRGTTPCKECNRTGYVDSPGVW